MFHSKSICFKHTLYNAIGNFKPRKLGNEYSKAFLASRLQKKNEKNAWLLNLNYRDKNKFWKISKNYNKKYTTKTAFIYEKLFNEKIFKEDDLHKEHLKTFDNKISGFKTQLIGKSDHYSISEDDVKNVIANLKNRKSIGFSDVSNEINLKFENVL
ncbi:hypothetical protein BpHYR1_014225 [Brachionus plicatilis]|uniref:RNA-directed DNA polymerase from mobile element jockey-like n=1 Tax=Brachionus plicatilis TaxID=10195 RepID=A0A3M7SBK9_BRAPC|nr:hypothetical protein BpHYR1_014225 [Brachionus plicatilis]